MKLLKVFSWIGVIVLIIVVITSVITHKNIQEAEANRDTRLDMYELTKHWVMDEIRDYILINNEDSYKNVKKRINMTPDLKKDLFGDRFSYAKFPSYSSIGFVDAQYTLEREDGFIVYLLANVTKDNQTKEMNFMVFIHNNKIYDLIAY